MAIGPMGATKAASLFQLRHSLVDSRIARTFLPKVKAALDRMNVDLRGSGQIAATYSGQNPKQFTHKKIGEW